jgi:hypothetical protein
MLLFVLVLVCGSQGVARCPAQPTVLPEVPAEAVPLLGHWYLRMHPEEAAALEEMGFLIDLMFGADALVAALSGDAAAPEVTRLSDLLGRFVGQVRTIMSTNVTIEPGSFVYHSPDSEESFRWHLAEAVSPEELHVVLESVADGGTSSARVDLLGDGLVRWTFDDEDEVWLSQEPEPFLVMLNEKAADR